MKNADPIQRTSLEVRILSMLNDKVHAVMLSDLVDSINPDQKEGIICTVFDFQSEGLVSISELDDGGQLVRLNPQGKHLLSQIYSGRASCD